MRKILLTSFTLMFALAFVNAQKTWNFSNSPFGAAVTYSANTTVDGLLIMAGSSTTVAIDANAKKNGDLSFTYRIKMGGSATFDAATPNLPTSRALAFGVTGPGTIQIAALSSSSSADRTLNISDGNSVLGTFNAPGSFTDANGNNVELQTFNYTGGAGTIYIYSPSSGVNIYYLSAATYSPSSTKTILDKSNFTIKENEISNENNYQVEIYSVVGKQMMISSESVISTSSLPKGIYILKAKGLEGGVKFAI